MAIKHTEDFRQEAVRIALTRALPRRRVASDLGVGFSTLSKWVSQYWPSDLTAQPQADLARENEAAIFQYIHGFYNTRRRHSYLAGISPLGFRS